MWGSCGCSVTQRARHPETCRDGAGAPPSVCEGGSFVPSLRALCALCGKFFSFPTNLGLGVLFRRSRTQRARHPERSEGSLFLLSVPRGSRLDLLVVAALRRPPRFCSGRSSDRCFSAASLPSSPVAQALLPVLLGVRRPGAAFTPAQNSTQTNDWQPGLAWQKRQQAAALQRRWHKRQRYIERAFHFGTWRLQDDHPPTPTLFRYRVRKP